MLNKLQTMFGKLEAHQWDSRGDNNEEKKKTPHLKGTVPRVAMLALKITTFPLNAHPRISAGSTIVCDQVWWERITELYDCHQRVSALVGCRT